MSNFDPYHDWLGIPAGSRPVHHYALLGLKLFASEPPVIAEAADERLARLQSHLQGPHAADAQRLMAEVTAARAALISAANRKAYDAVLRQQLGMPPAAESPTMARPAVAAPAAAPVPPAAAPIPHAAVPGAAVPGAIPVAPAAVPMAAMPIGQVPYAAGMPQAAIPQAAMPGYAYPAAPAAPYGAPYPAQPMAGVPYGAHLATDSGSLEDVAMRPRKFRRSSTGSMAAVGVALAIIGTAGAVCFAYRDQIMAALEGKQQVIIEEDPKVVAEELAQKRYEELLEKQRAAAEAKKAREEKNAPPPQEDLNRRMANNFGSTPPQMEPPQQRPKPKPAPPKPAPKPAAMSVSIKPVTPEEQAAVAKTLAAARAAMGDRNLGKVDEQLNLAMLEASSADSLAAIDHVRTLQECLDQFWKAVRERVKGLKAIDELQIDGKQMIVVDADGEHLSVRVDGQVRDYLIEKLPTGMAYSLAKEWLHAGDVQSRVVLAAFQVTDPKANRADGMQVLQQAAAEGSDTAKTLLKVFGTGA